ncbi:hypothetical protein L6452_01266 [Arctium lappa]|uniref:Uncharacterized protein n=2 Tax=Arctium lappa TaxID=4217 RepID=A0ACB8Z5C0_ARCLA|nr:hypothetical protein L6452_32306 [Arctium lappa]KAI3770144.1 hypothetical protein L6452_01266 [Arctium lappa]
MRKNVQLKVKVKVKEEYNNFRAAVEISCEPFVRKHVRRIFMDNATVSTSPTADGNVDIDSHHQFAEIKWFFSPQ